MPSYLRTALMVLIGLLLGLWAGVGFGRVVHGNRLRNAELAEVRRANARGDWRTMKGAQEAADIHTPRIVEGMLMTVSVSVLICGLAFVEWKHRRASRGD